MDDAIMAEILRTTCDRFCTSKRKSEQCDTYEVLSMSA